MIKIISEHMLFIIIVVSILKIVSDYMILYHCPFHA